MSESGSDTASGAHARETATGRYAGRWRHIVWPGDDFDPALGGKACALAALHGSGLPVPAFFVLRPTAFDAEPGAAAQTPERSSAQATRAAAHAVLSGNARAELQAAVEILAGDGSLLAVRSSAADEDSAHRAFAGQLESKVFVPASAVAESVAEVWTSGFSERVRAYRDATGLGSEVRPPAVIVQRAVAGTYSGVAFSADPVSGRRSIAVVAAVAGPGETLVSGATDAETWFVDRAGHIVAHRAGPSPTALGTQRVTEIATLAARAETYFGRPQDIEWTICGSDLLLLQSRAITTIAQMPDPDGPLALWDSSNIAENYGGVISTLTYSLAHRVYTSAFQQFCTLAGVPGRVVAAHAGTFRGLVGLVQGRLHYNLVNWHRALALLPGAATNRRLFEQMIGARESNLLETPASRHTSAARMRPIDHIRVAGVLTWRGMRIDARVRAYLRDQTRALDAHELPLERLRVDELAAHYREVEAVATVLAGVPPLNDFLLMVLHGALRRLLARWVPRECITLENELLAGVTPAIAAEISAAIARMARLAAGHAELVELLCDGSRHAIERALSAHAALADEYHDYLARFGERCLDELKLESPSLLDDPLPLLRTVGNLARSGLPSQTSRVPPAASRRDVENALRESVPGSVLQRSALRWLAAAVRSRMRDREALRFLRTRIFGHARRIAAELGHRLVASNVLADTRDVFHLQWDELLGYVEGWAATTDLAGLVAVRRAEFDRHARTPAPAERFETRGIPYIGHDFGRTMRREHTTIGATLLGAPCSPGVVRARVRVVHAARSAELGAGEIIVAERTDPGWVVLFPVAAGLLVERGNVLSHCAIVARETGLPMIASLPGLLTWLADGDLVEMDGASGRVTRVARAGQSEGRAHTDAA